MSMEYQQSSIRQHRPNMLSDLQRTLTTVQRSSYQPIYSYPVLGHGCEVVWAGNADRTKRQPVRYSPHQSVYRPILGRGSELADALNESRRKEIAAHFALYQTLYTRPAFGNGSGLVDAALEKKREAIAAQYSLFETLYGPSVPGHINQQTLFNIPVGNHPTLTPMLIIRPGPAHQLNTQLSPTYGNAVALPQNQAMFVFYPPPVTAAKLTICPVHGFGPCPSSGNLAGTLLSSDANVHAMSATLAGYPYMPITPTYGLRGPN